MRVIIAVLAALLFCAGLQALAQAPNLTLPIQDARSTAKNGGGQPFQKTPQQCRKNPMSCLPKTGGGGRGTNPGSPAPGGGKGGTSGGGDPGDPLIYTEESISPIYLNVAWNGPVPAVSWNADPTNPANCQHTLMAVSGGSAQGGAFLPYPFPLFVSDATISQTTAYAGDGDTNAIGTIGLGDSLQFTALQGDAIGTTTGIAMAPSMYGVGWDLAVVPVHNFYYTPTPGGTLTPCPSVGSFPRPWSGGYVGMQLNYNITIPYVFQSGGDGLIGYVGQSGHSGIGFHYSTMLIQNVVDTTQIILITVRVFQSHELQGADLADPGYQNSFGEQVGVIGDAGPNAGNAIIGIRLGVDSLVSNCGTMSYTSPFSGSLTPQNICWRMSAAQLSSTIATINAAPYSPRNNYDLTASNWQVLLINQDYETWTHAGGDQRIGLNTSGFQFWIQ